MVPLSYNCRNLVVRWKTTLMTASGFALAVMALIVMLAFVNGVRKVCTDTGEAENVIVLKEGNFDEVLSQIDRRAALPVEITPGVLVGGDHRPVASREVFVAVTQWDEKRGEYHQLQARGVYPIAALVHSRVRMIEGRMFRRNCREVVVGAAVARQRQIALGDQLPLGQVTWNVVGIFEAAGSAFESEIWCDLDLLADHFHRKGIYTCLVLRTASPAAARGVVERLEENRAVDVEAQTEPDYYRQQAAQTNLLRTGAIVISVFMALGAVFGVTNTMFAAIAERTKDIAVMRLLGFRRRQILFSFLFEAVLIAVIGGAVGCALGYAVNGLSLSTALGGKSIAFAFRVDATTLTVGAAFALAMGVIGGLLPATAAMRVHPLQSVR